MLIKHTALSQWETGNETERSAKIFSRVSAHICGSGHQLHVPSAWSLCPPPKKNLYQAENEASAPSVLQNLPSMWDILSAASSLCLNYGRRLCKKSFHKTPCTKVSWTLPVGEAHRWSWIPSTAGRFLWASSPASAPLTPEETHMLSVSWTIFPAQTQPELRRCFRR